jgi:hypothetical protein
MGSDTDLVLCCQGSDIPHRPGIPGMPAGSDIARGNKWKEQVFVAYTLPYIAIQINSSSHY